MRISIDWDGSGGGRVGYCGRDGTSEGGDKGGKDRWFYDSRHVCSIVSVFVVIIPTPGSGAAHTVCFVAS